MERPKQIRWQLVAIGVIVLAASVLLYHLVLGNTSVGGVFSQILSVTWPLFLGMALAFILSAPVRFVEQKLFGRTPLKWRAKRNLSIAVVHLVALTLIGWLLFYLVPQVGYAIEGLANDMGGYLQEALDFIENNFQAPLAFLSQFEISLQGVLTYLSNLLLEQSSSIWDIAVGTIGGILRVTIGVAVSIYMLANGKSMSGQAKKTTRALFRHRTAATLIRTTAYAATVFRKYITGQCLDALIVGVVCFVAMTLLQLPYALVISVLVAVTNIIPMFGPFIGAIPSALLILLVNPIQAFIFVIMIIILQQIDGNIILPRIVGETTGLGAFWVLTALVIGGGLFGIWGMIFAVPVFTLCYRGIAHFVKLRLRQKGMPAETDKYMNEMENNNESI